MTTSTTTVMEGLAFPEGARWHEGHLWFSEKRGHRVVRMDVDGNVAGSVEVPGQPSGLGWRPDGTLLIVSMVDSLLLEVVDGELREAADLSDLTVGKANDMVVDGRGNAYVGHFGYDLLRGDPPAPATLLLVTLDGAARVVAKDVEFPNGCVVAPDGGTLIVAETQTCRLSAFDIEEDGGLSRRRAFAEIEPTRPDGICLDAEGAVWVADPLHCEVARVVEGGEITDRIPTSSGDGAFACALGGPDRRTLYVCTYPEEASMSADPPAVGRIEQAEVAVPGAGWP